MGTIVPVFPLCRATRKERASTFETPGDQHRTHETAMAEPPWQPTIPTRCPTETASHLRPPDDLFRKMPEAHPPKPAWVEPPRRTRHQFPPRESGYFPLS